MSGRVNLDAHDADAASEDEGECAQECEHGCDNRDEVSSESEHAQGMDRARRRGARHRLRRQPMHPERASNDE